jgi:hypothetical protein
MLEVLNRTGFFRGRPLNRAQVDEMYRFAKWGQGGARRLCKDEPIGKINRALRFLLDEKKPLPARFQKFIQLRGAGTWTTSLILSKWRPTKYAFVALGGSGANPFMRKKMFDRLSGDQIERAQIGALARYGIEKESDYWPPTIYYLTLSEILREAIELLNLRYYWEIQNILWDATRRSGHRLPADEMKLTRILSAEAIGASDTKGMSIVKRYEMSQGRDPDDSYSLTDAGYDIESKKNGQVVRYIEVKTRFRSFSWPVALTSNEYKIAKQLRERYYLYVVRGDNLLFIVKNPAESCTIKAIPREPDRELTDWERIGNRILVP